MLNLILKEANKKEHVKSIKKNIYPRYHPNHPSSLYFIEYLKLSHLLYNKNEGNISINDCFHFTRNDF